MARAVCVSLTCLAATSWVAGCATAPLQTASNYAGQGASAVYHTGSDVYAGVGTAAKKPFQDLNMMQDPIPMVLLRAELDPYAVKGLTSCDVVMSRVAELDLALGPDLDSPKDESKNKITADAGLASAAALEAAAAAAEGFMPVRSVVKMVSGASKYEKHVKHAILAGTERRTFLKAIGAMHDCGWPAAPLTLTAADAKIVTIWGPPIVAAAPTAARLPNITIQTVAAAPTAVVVQTAALSPPRSTPPSSIGRESGAAAPPTLQSFATPVALVPNPSGTATLGSTQPSASPYVSGSAPWASPPHGGR
jgi:hypothetical protein